MDPQGTLGFLVTSVTVLCHLHQVRCAGTLTLALKQRKRDLQLHLPWRPLYDLLIALTADPTPRIDGEQWIDERCQFSSR